jgi:hypothetical protein
MPRLTLDQAIDRLVDRLPVADRRQRARCRRLGLLLGLFRNHQYGGCRVGDWPASSFRPAASAWLTTLYDPAGPFPSVLGPTFGLDALERLRRAHQLGTATLSRAEKQRLTRQLHGVPARFRVPADGALALGAGPGPWFQAGPLQVVACELSKCHLSQDLPERPRVVGYDDDFYLPVLLPLYGGPLVFHATAASPHPRPDLLQPLLIPADWFVQAGRADDPAVLQPVGDQWTQPATEPVSP